MGQIKDQVALRVITYLPDTVEATCDLIRTNFEVKEELDKGAENTERGIFGYSSHHFLVMLSPERRSMIEYQHSAQLEFEIQVRTTLQHAWAEFEHDVRYKGALPEGMQPKFGRRFALAAGLIELADKEFSEINAALEELEKTEAAKTRTPLSQLTPESLAAWLLDRYPGVQRSKTGHYEWMIEVLLDLGVHTFEDLANSLGNVNSDSVAAAMNHPYPPGVVRRLDDDLLASIGDAYCEMEVNAKRIETLRERLSKLSN